jgi:hypothetical protein
MKIEFCGAIVEIADEQAGPLEFMRCAEAVFLAAGYYRSELAEVAGEWLEDYRLAQAEPGMEA